jgi:hypothetical protein
MSVLAFQVGLCNLHSVTGENTICGRRCPDRTVEGHVVVELAEDVEGKLDG